MRRALILALAIAVAAAFRSVEVEDESISETIFRPGYEYTYRYESQVLSGIRTVSSQVAGIKIHALVKLQYQRSEGFVFKMHRVTLFKVNDVVTGLHKIEILPDSEMTRLTGEQEQAMIEQLVKPIKFRYENGEVSEVKTMRSDKYWSINIKKGLISMFQLKLTGRTSSWSDSDSFPESSSLSSGRSIKTKLFDTFSPVGSRRLQTPRLDNAFKTMEMDVNGECETKYVINSERSEDLTIVSDMFVTKVKNFDNCLTKNSWDQGLFAHMPHLPSERNLIQPSFEAEYVLSGDRHHFLIKKATVEANYFFKPYGLEGGQLSTHISQKLYLESTSEIHEPFPFENPVVEKHGLKMEIPRAYFSSENSINGENYGEQEWKEVIDTKLNKLISAIYPVMQETATAELFQLQLILRHVPRRQLFAIIKSFVREESVSEEFNKKREILLDILPTCINADTGKVLLDLIRDGTIRGIRARLSISAMVLTIKPTPEIVKFMMTMYREGETLERTTPHLRQTLLLGVGTLCNKMINHMRKVNKPIPELTSAIEEIAQELTGLLSEASSEMDKIRVLKAMGNMGAKEVITPIKSIIEDRSLSKILRIEAVTALKKLARPFDKLVHPVLVSVILDKSEFVRIRIAAIIVLRESLPSFTTLQLMAHCLRTEPSTQVKTFIYTTIVSLANGLSNHEPVFPELFQLKKDARKVLKTVRAVPVGVFDSKEIKASFYSERLNMGHTWNIDVIKAERSGLPHTFFSTFQKTIFGNKLKLAKVGAEGEMVTAILRRLIGPYGLLKDIFKNKASFFDLLKPLVRPEMTSQWRDLIGKKSYEAIGEDEIEGLVFGELFGYEMVYKKFDKETVDRWMNIVMKRAPEFLTKLREGFTIDTFKTLSLACNSLVLPTPVGIPLSLNVSANAIVKFNGYVKARSLPSFMDFIRRRPFMTKKIEIETRFKPSWNVEVFGYMGVDARWLRSGVALKGHLFGKMPVKGEIVVDPIDSKVTFKIEPPTEITKSFVAKIEPVTFVFYVPVNKERLPFTVELKPLKTHEHIKHFNFEKVLACQITGLEFNFNAKWTKCGATWCPYYPLTGKQEVAFGFKSLSSTPKEIVFTIKKFTQDWFAEQEFYEAGSYSQPENYRTTPREEYYDETGFETVVKDSIISSPRKVELFFELGLNGYHSNKMLKSKFTWLSENNYLEHQFNFQVFTVQSADFEQFKFMFNSVWKSPYMFDFTEYNTKEPIGKIEIHFGRSGFSEKIVKCKIWELDASTWNEELHLEGVEYSTELTTIKGLTPYVFRYGFEFVFPEEVTPRGQMYLTKIHDLIKYGLYRYLKVGIPEHIPQNKIVVYAKYLTKVEKLSFIIKTPRETDMILNVPIHCPWSLYYRPNLHDVNPKYLYSNVTSELDIEQFDEPSYDSYDKYKDYTPSLLGVCKIRKDKLMSFDGTPVMLPIHLSETGGSRCDVLLARDCSHRGTFAVTGYFKHGHWAIKIIVPKYMVEFIPEVSSDRFEVKVNDEVLRVRYDSEVKLYEEFHNENSELLATIAKIGEGLKIKFHELGVTIVMEERSKIFIKVSPLSVLQGRLCGLCGNNNYDVSDDMTSLMGKKMPSSRMFVMDNIMPSGYCDASDYESKLTLRHSDYCTMKKTWMMERTVHNVYKTCFSKQAVTACRRHCTVADTTTRTLRFVCMSTENENAQQLISKYHSGQTDLTNYLTEFESTYDEEIEIPQSCTSNY